MINALRLLQVLPLGRQFNSLVNPDAPQRRVSLLGQRFVGSLLSTGLMLGSLLGLSAAAGFFLGEAQDIVLLDISCSAITSR